MKPILEYHNQMLMGWLMPAFPIMDTPASITMDELILMYVKDYERARSLMLPISNPGRVLVGGKIGQPYEGAEFCYVLLNMKWWKDWKGGKYTESSSELLLSGKQYKSSFEFKVVDYDSIGYPFYNKAYELV